MSKSTPVLLNSGETAVLTGNALGHLATMDEASVQCCITSPPYYGQRDYGCDGQIGLEPTASAFVLRLVEVFAEVKRVLAEDGVLWLVIGDSYCGAVSGARDAGRWPKQSRNKGSHAVRHAKAEPGVKRKSLLGVPWMLAFALRADGWFLRSNVIWRKTNAMADPTSDRPENEHEHVFLLTKSSRYFFEPTAIPGRSVWSIATQPRPGTNYATFPPKLIKPMVLAGCPAGGTVLDPFAGTGTTGEVALAHGRRFVGIELNPADAAEANRRLAPRPNTRGGG